MPSIVRESPFHVFLSYSVDDGMSWLIYDQPLPFIDTAEYIPSSETRRDVWTQFQTDPGIVFDDNGRGYVMVMGGYHDNEEVDSTTCVPQIDEIRPEYYIDRDSIYMYRFTYNDTSHELDMDGPFWTVNPKFSDPNEAYDHPWIAAYHPAGYLVNTEFTSVYADSRHDAAVHIQFFTKNDVDTTADGEQISGIEDYRVHLNTIDPLTQAPIVVLDADGKPIILTVYNRICWIDTDTPPAAGSTWICDWTMDMDSVLSGTGIISGEMRFGILFEYSDGPSGEAECGYVKVFQPSALAASGSRSDRWFFVYQARTDDCDVGSDWSRIFLVISEIDPDSGLRVFSDPIQISQNYEYGDCSHDIDPEISLTEDGTIFIWWRTIAGEYQDGDEWACASPGTTGGLHSPITFQRGAIIRPEVFPSTPIIYLEPEDIRVEEITISNQYGMVENLPVHCGRSTVGSREHFYGEYDFSVGGNTHIHIPFTIPHSTGSVFESQMMHSIVTPYNY